MLKVILMEVEVLKKEDKYIELKFINEDPSLFYALRDVLAQDKNVEFVAALHQHPQIDNTILSVRIKKGDPVAVINNALKKMNTTIESLEKALF